MRWVNPKHRSFIIRSATDGSKVNPRQHKIVDFQLQSECAVASAPSRHHKLASKNGRCDQRWQCID